MPDPLLFLQAMGSAVIASMLVVLASLAASQRLGRMWLNSACILGSGVGLFVGYAVLALHLSWPPANGLDRFLEIVVPAALVVESLSGLSSVPRWVAWTMRIALAAAIPRVLLHTSVHLSGSDPTQWLSTIDLLRYSVLLAGTWGLLSWLSQRSPGISIPLALALAIQCAGITIMMAGYLKGGAVALPLAATVVGTSFGARLMISRPIMSPLIGIGVVGLFGTLFVGHFFGRLSENSVLAMLLAPLLCWISEIPLLRRRKPWVIGWLRLFTVAIPLIVVLAIAKRTFDRDMAPLLGAVGTSPTWFEQRSR